MMRGETCVSNECMPITESPTEGPTNGPTESPTISPRPTISPGPTASPTPEPTYVRWAKSEPWCADCHDGNEDSTMGFADPIGNFFQESTECEDIPDSIQFEMLESGDFETCSWVVNADPQDLQARCGLEVQHGMNFYLVRDLCPKSCGECLPI